VSDFPEAVERLHEYIVGDLTEDDYSMDVWQALQQLATLRERFEAVERERDEAQAVGLEWAQMAAKDAGRAEAAERELEIHTALDEIEPVKELRKRAEAAEARVRELEAGSCGRI
jgi:hypothetical protein